MGMIRCELHGIQGFLHACAHVTEALRSGVILPRRRALEIEVCDACWQRHDLERFTSGEWTGWSPAVAAKYDELSADVEVDCSECIAAAQLAAARNKGSPDPFRAYERTMTFLQLDVVRRLESELLGAFDFRRSVVEPANPAVWVRYGALTYPLTTTIYYVTDRETQDAILRFLADFFEGRPQDQYRVEFYRSESWNQHPEDPDLWSRGPEELVREHEAGNSSR